MVGILGKKIDMFQIFIDNQAVPVTAVEAGPCKIVDKKVEDKNGYNAISMAFGKKSSKKVSKAMRTIFEKAGSETSAVVKEFSVDNIDDYNIGDTISVANLKGVKYVDVVAKSKGKGFQGVMKRHNFAGGPKSHGSTLFHRRPGSIGNFASSGRVFPGKKMPGQMGNKRVTVQNLRVIRIEEEDNLLLVRGAIPGPKGSYVMVKPSLKRGAR